MSMVTGAHRLLGRGGLRTAARQYELSHPSPDRRGPPAGVPASSGPVPLRQRCRRAAAAESGGGEHPVQVEVAVLEPTRVRQRMEIGSRDSSAEARFVISPTIQTRPSAASIPGRSSSPRIDAKEE